MKNPTRAPAPRQRTVRREIRALVDMPWVRRIVQCGRAGLLAFVLSAAASGNTPLPLALGFLVGLDADWTVLAAAGGSCAGYLLFWGPEACLEPMAGIVAGLLAAALFAGTELRRRAWFLPALCGAMTAVLGLVFLLARGMVDSSGFVGFLLRVGCAAGSAAVLSSTRTPEREIWNGRGSGISQSTSASSTMPTQTRPIIFRFNFFTVILLS